MKKIQDVLDIEKIAELVKKGLNNILIIADDVSGVPLRIMASTGMFSGFDFDKEGFIELMKILQMSENFKKDLINFKEKYGN